MKPNALMFRFALLLALVSGLPGLFLAQKAPRQERLLNGLKVVMWPDAAASRVSVRIRVHSGSAFDPQGKEGVMYLLARNFFPTEASRDFFAEDLGGKVEVVSNYDYIQINAESNPESVVPMLDTLAQVVSNPTIDKETTDRLKAEVLAEIDRREKSPGYLADQAVAKRLFGKFPYGRPETGTKDSLSRIDFAELAFAKSRFFGADNATITISGKFDPDLAYRAVRRYLGAWLKSDKRVPSTFEQPAPPDIETLEITTDLKGENQIRFALRGFGRGDKDYVAAEILARVLDARLKASVSPREIRDPFVRQDAHFLPGILLFGYEALPAPLPGAGSASDLRSSPKLLSQTLSKPISPDEFSKAKADLARVFEARGLDEWWLDGDTYKVPAGQEKKTLEAISISEVQRVANEVSNRPAATVVVIAGAAGQPNND